FSKTVGDKHPERIQGVVAGPDTEPTLILCEKLMLGNRTIIGSRDKGCIPRDVFRSTVAVRSSMVEVPAAIDTDQTRSFGCKVRATIEPGHRFRLIIISERLN